MNFIRDTLPQALRADRFCAKKLMRESKQDCGSTNERSNRATICLRTYCLKINRSPLPCDRCKWPALNGLSHENSPHSRQEILLEQRRGELDKLHSPDPSDIGRERCAGGLHAPAFSLGPLLHICRSGRVRFTRGGHEHPDNENRPLPQSAHWRRRWMPCRSCALPRLLLRRNGGPTWRGTRGRDKVASSLYPLAQGSRNHQRPSQPRP